MNQKEKIKSIHILITTLINFEENSCFTDLQEDINKLVKKLKSKKFDIESEERIYPNNNNNINNNNYNIENSEIKSKSLNEEEHENKKNLDEKNFRNIYSVNRNVRFFPSRKYKITYLTTSITEVQNHYNKNFQLGEIISIKYNELKRKTEVILEFKLPKKLSLNNNLLKVFNKQTPFSIENFPNKKANNDLINCEIELKKIDNILIGSEIISNNIVINDNKNRKFEWDYKLKYNFRLSCSSNKIKTYSFLELKLKMINDLRNLCYNTENFNGTKYCNHLKSFLSNIEVIYPNEYIISTVFVNSLIELNEKRTNNRDSLELPITIISIDNKFEELINQTKCHFRTVIKFLNFNITISLILK
jgi:hypothetical protein